jgi:hypothetical protein
MRALASALSLYFRLGLPVPLSLPESSARACCSRDISASIAAANSDVFMGDLEWRILRFRCCGGYMSSNYELVSVSGRLQGMGRDVACTVFAEKVSRRGADAYEYVRPFITGAPRDLQNGLYKLTFDGRVLSAQLCNGGWSSPIAT